MTSLDSAIRKEYSDLGIPADRIVSDPKTSAAFLDAVNDHLPKKQQVGQETLNSRLLNLRRRGEDKGGLPRMQRGYAGRNRPD